MKGISPAKIQEIQEELKKANKVLDEYFRKEALRRREESSKFTQMQNRGLIGQESWMKGTRSML